MNKKQTIAILAPLVLIGGMIPVFRWLADVLGETLGWYLGLIIYWILWGAIFPYLMIGRKKIKQLIAPQRLNTRIFLLVLFPIAMASLYQLIPGLEYEKQSVWILLMYLSTTFGNGFFEEVLWRGVYMTLFPDNLMFRYIWPGIWFALWHYAPVSVADGNVLMMVIGSGIFGFYLSFLAKQTDSIWWNIVAHTLGGMVMIV